MDFSLGQFPSGPERAARRSGVAWMWLLAGTLGAGSGCTGGSLGSPVPGASEPQAAVGLPRSVWDGIYMEDQAELGERLYRQECARCHGATLIGGETGPALAGDLFMSLWYGSTAPTCSVGYVRPCLSTAQEGSVPSSTRTCSTTVFAKTNLPLGRTGSKPTRVP